jgi:hypothetical protein
VVGWVLSTDRKGFDMSDAQRNREAQAWKLGVRYAATEGPRHALFNAAMDIQREARTNEDRLRITWAFDDGASGVAWGDFDYAEGGAA